jgi:GNAT superfamily N-acetyltransferase
MPGLFSYREVTATDVPEMARCRLLDPAADPADERMVANFDGRHHPQQALAPRVGYVAVGPPGMVGYIAGHLSRRFNCDGELQYLFVSWTYRRQGVARDLVAHLAAWFARHRASYVCVNVNSQSPAARPFYLSLGATDL